MDVRRLAAVEGSLAADMDPVTDMVGQDNIAGAEAVVVVVDCRSLSARTDPCPYLLLLLLVDWELS